MTTQSKGGRPPKEQGELLNKNVTVRFTEREHGFITRQADRADYSLSEFCRRAAMQQPVKERITPEVMRQLKSLFGIANNLNQAMHLAHMYNLKCQADEIEMMIDEVLTLINKVRLS